MSIHACVFLIPNNVGRKGCLRSELGEVQVWGVVPRPEDVEEAVGQPAARRPEGGQGQGDVRVEEEESGFGKEIANWTIYPAVLMRLSIS